MQALGLVRIFKKQNFVEISFKKVQSVKRWGWAQVCTYECFYSDLLIAIDLCFLFIIKLKFFPGK